MILADTSIWVDHLKAGNAQLEGLLNEGQLLCHPLIVAELALGSLRRRTEILSLLDNLPSAPVAEISEVRTLIESRLLFARGIGFVDASLLASCLLMPGTDLWTLDKKLIAVSGHLSVSSLSR